MVPALCLVCGFVHGLLVGGACWLCLLVGAALPPLLTLRCVPLAVLACRSPVVDAEPTSPTNATVVVSIPPNGPWARYNLTTCPVAGPASECVNTTCTTPSSCPVTGLDPGTTYVTTVGWRVVLDD